MVHTMDYQIPLLFCLSGLCLFLLKFWFSSKGKSSKLPPIPKPWSIVANIFQLFRNPHRSLTLLSKIYGPLITLKLGSVTIVVVSSVDMAKEVFQKHDLAFSSRNVVEAAKSLNHHKHSMVWLPVSPKWRNLRKISSVELFTKKQLDCTKLLRQNKLVELLEHVREGCTNARAVEIGKVAFTTSLNFLSNTLFSIDLASHSSASSHEFMELVQAILRVGGKPYLGDFFPVLSYFDLLGVRRSTEAYFRKFFAIFDGIIDQRVSVADPSSPSYNNDDFLATLIKISKEDGSDLSLDDIKHLLLDLFVAGTETTSITVEWAMTELLRNPVKMEKAQSELDEILGKIDGLIQESDIARLPYLQAVVKETLRLHPPGPLLIPHKADNDVDFLGYIFPRNTQLLINVWAIGRDPDTWQNPGEFSPERFLESEIDIRGQHFELLPFGSGRRMCPGLPLAYRMMHMMLANLVYYFNWELPNGMRGQDVDMTDKFALGLQKANPLLAVPVSQKRPLAVNK